MCLDTRRRRRRRQWARCIAPATLVGRATGEQKIYGQHVEGLKLVGGPVRVAESGGVSPQWRRDGGELFFMKRGTVMAAAFDAKRDRPAGVPHPLFTIACSGGGALGFERSYAVTPD